MKETLPWIIRGILLYHLFAFGLSLYTFNIDASGYTLYRFDTLAKLLFALAWLGITLRKRWAAFGYFLLCLYELAMRLFFRNTTFGDVFGDVLFPVDLLFIFMLLIAYRAHFNTERTS
jgi:hypothetical protein